MTEIEGDRLRKLILHLRYEGNKKLRSQRQLANEIGVKQRAIYDWEQGRGINATNRGKLANFLGQTVDALNTYLNGSISLKTLLGDTSVEAPQSRRLLQILDWLPTLRSGEVFEIVWQGLPMLRSGEVFRVVQRGFQFLAGYFSLAPSVLVPPLKEPAIADLLRDLPDKTLLAFFSAPRIEELRSGGYPTDEELIVLEHYLDDSWSLHRLREVRDRDFPAQSTPQPEEHQPNGHEH